MPFDGGFLNFVFFFFQFHIQIHAIQTYIGYDLKFKLNARILSIYIHFYEAFLLKTRWCNLLALGFKQLLENLYELFIFWNVGLK